MADWGTRTPVRVHQSTSPRPSDRVAGGPWRSDAAGTAASEEGSPQRIWPLGQIRPGSRTPFNGEPASAGGRAGPMWSRASCTFVQMAGVNCVCHLLTPSRILPGRYGPGIFGVRDPRFDMAGEVGVPALRGGRAEPDRADPRSDPPLLLYRYLTISREAGMM